MAVSKLSRLLWMNKTRQLNLVQKTIFLNTFALSKIWYVGSIIPMQANTCKKVIQLVRQYLWQGHAVIVAFNEITLPKSKGGLNLHHPDFKSRALFVNKLHCARDNNLADLINMIENVPMKEMPPEFSYLNKAILDLRKLRSANTNSLLSSEIYNKMIEGLPMVKVVRENQNQSWIDIFKNINNKILSSSRRSICYLFIHKKMISRELFYRQRRVSSPYCTSCNTAIETLQHKFFECTSINTLWQYTLAKIRRINSRKFRNKNYEICMYPSLTFLSRVEREETMKHISNYLQYVFETSEEDRSLDHYTYSLSL
ncbi:uncharacterized protein LOC134218275 [Armigeres subalbatus]|uniref:uncharacterized protein LOC134218275 n=1 Tax=Armigeres subalbatus TaxID=124917 RepID=UPI002ED2DC92